MVQWITDYLRNYKDYFNQGTNTFFRKSRTSFSIGLGTVRKVKRRGKK